MTKIFYPVLAENTGEVIFVFLESPSRNPAEAAAGGRKNSLKEDTEINGLRVGRGTSGNQTPVLFKVLIRGDGLAETEETKLPRPVFSSTFTIGTANN